MAFTKGDMYFSDYNWKAKYEGDDPKVTGEPDRTLLDRNEGYEVLYFVNTCARKWNWDGDDNGSYQKIEKLLRKVPSFIRAQESIKLWMEQNWKTYWDHL